MEQPLSKLTSDEHLSLIFRHYNGDTDGAEEQALQAWRALTPENERFFKEARQLHGELMPPEPEQGFDVGKGWQDLSKRLNFQETPVIPIKPKGRRPWAYGLLAAAAILLTFLFLPK